MEMSDYRKLDRKELDFLVGISCYKRRFKGEKHMLVFAKETLGCIASELSDIGKQISLVLAKELQFAIDEAEESCKTIVNCIYKLDSSPKNPERYKKIQMLADVKISMAFNDNPSLKKAIDMLERHFAYDTPYDVSEIKELSNDAVDFNEKAVFETLIKIL